MDAKTLDALKRSIAKWDANAASPNLGRATTGVGSCPLCRLFHSDFKGSGAVECKGCPVKAATRKIFCRGTPYEKAMEALYDGNSAEFRSAAKEEADFLRSLLPDGGSA